jgi:hypothetical protein
MTKPKLTRGGGRWWCINGEFGGVGTTPREAWDSMNEMIERWLSPMYIIQPDGSIKTEWPRTTRPYLTHPDASLRAWVKP